RAGPVATTRTAWPSAFRCWNKAGVRSAATEPVTPSKTLATAVRLHGVEQSVGQLRPLDPPVLSPERAEEGVARGPFQGVRHHQVAPRLPPRALGDSEQLRVGDADFQFELDEGAAEAPVAAEAVDQLGRAHQPQPQLRLVTLDLAGRGHRAPGV